MLETWNLVHTSRGSIQPFFVNRFFLVRLELLPVLNGLTWNWTFTYSRTIYALGLVSFFFPFCGASNYYYVKHILYGTIKVFEAWTTLIKINYFKNSNKFDFVLFGHWIASFFLINKHEQSCIAAKYCVLLVPLLLLSLLSLLCIICTVVFIVVVECLHSAGLAFNVLLLLLHFTNT